MLYFKIDKALEVVAISADYPDECKQADGNGRGPWARQPQEGGDLFGEGWLARWDILENPAPWMFAQQLAESASKFSGQAYIAVDKGESVSPRYDVIKAPAEGDECSMSFNGDSYPVGKITKMSSSKRFIMVDGPRGKLRFVRRAETAAWLYKGWSLLPGVRNDFNREF